MSKLKPWIMASRPKTLPAAIAPVLIGLALAYADGAFSPTIAGATLMAALCLQIGTNYANDYFDFLHGADTEDRQGPTRITQAGLVTLSQMRWGTAIVFLVAALFGAILVFHGGWPILVIGLLSIAAGVFYTAGPFPLGYLGLGDLLVLLFFGFAAVGGTYYLQTGHVTTQALLAGVAPGLLSTAILAVNNLRDIDTDRQTGKRTLAVRFGARFAKVEYLGCLLVAAGVPLLLCSLVRDHYFALASMAVLLLAVPSIRIVCVGPGGPVLNQVLASTGRVLFLFSVVFCVGWLL